MESNISSISSNISTTPITTPITILTATNININIFTIYNNIQYFLKFYLYSAVDNQQYYNISLVDYTTKDNDTQHYLYFCKISNSNILSTYAITNNILPIKNIFLENYNAQFQTFNIIDSNNNYIVGINNDHTPNFSSLNISIKPLDFHYIILN